jgi:hypothetical protein
MRAVRLTEGLRAGQTERAPGARSRVRGGCRSQGALERTRTRAVNVLARPLPTALHALNLNPKAPIHL